MTDADEISTLRKKCQELDIDNKALKQTFHYIISIAESVPNDALSQIKNICEKELGIVSEKKQNLSGGN